MVGRGSDLKLLHQLRWDVAATIQVSPPLLTVNASETTTKTLILSGPDGQSFKIVAITSNIPGVVVKPRESSGTRHVLDVTVDPNTVGDAPRMGEIAVTTDLAAQRNVKIPVVRIGKKAKS